MKGKGLKDIEAAKDIYLEDGLNYTNSTLPHKATKKGGDTYPPKDTLQNNKTLHGKNNKNASPKIHRN